MAAAPVIRPATTEDAEPLAHLHAACFAEAWGDTEMARWLSLPTVVGLAAFEGWTPAGFVIAQAVADQAEILTLAVDLDRRRKGVGRALLAALETELARRDVRSLHLEVAEGNLAGLALYRRAGFAETARRRGYYVRPSGAEDALVMTKSLRND